MIVKKYAMCVHSVDSEASLAIKKRSLQKRHVCSQPKATFTRDDFDRDGKNRFDSDTLLPMSAFTRHDHGTGAVLQPCLYSLQHTVVVPCPFISGIHDSMQLCTRDGFSRPFVLVACSLHIKFK